MTENNWQEAFLVLGAQPSDPGAVIKRKYRKLIRQYHPDGQQAGQYSAEEPPDHRIRQIISAYETIRRTEHIWSRHSVNGAAAVRQNLKAYCERSLYGCYDMFGELPEDIYIKGSGRYIWDPDQEEFILYLKSINEAAGRLLLEKERKAGIYDPDDISDAAFHEIRNTVRLKVFHYLTQQFISPLECLEKIYGAGNREFTAAGWIRDKSRSRLKDPACTEEILTDSEKKAAAGIGWPCVMRKNRICIAVIAAGSEKMIPVSFDEDCPYYIAGALLSRKAADITASFDYGQGTGRGHLPVNVRIRIIDPEAAARLGDTGQYIEAELRRYGEACRSAFER